MLKQSLDITEYFLVTQEEFDNYQTRDKIKMQCSVCKENYYKTKKDALQHHKRQKLANMFCSSKCLSKSGQLSKSIFIKINCLHCDKEFEKSITNVKTVDQIYCSKNCCVVYQNTNRDKEEQLKINTKIKDTMIKNANKNKAEKMNKVIIVKPILDVKNITLKFNNNIKQFSYPFTYSYCQKYKLINNISICLICNSTIKHKQIRKICSKECFKIRMQKMHQEKPYIVLNRSNPESYLEKSFREYIEELGYIKDLSFIQEKYWILQSGKKYFSDFYFPSLNLIFELDGSQHENTIEEDKQRDLLIYKEFNIKTIRITHKEWVKKLRKEEIDNILK